MLRLSWSMLLVCLIVAAISAAPLHQDEHSDRDLSGKKSRRSEHGDKLLFKKRNKVLVDMIKKWEQRHPTGTGFIRTVDGGSSGISTDEDNSFKPVNNRHKLLNPDALIRGALIGESGIRRNRRSTVADLDKLTAHEMKDLLKKLVDKESLMRNNWLVEHNGKIYDLSKISSVCCDLGK
ncbi:uncharacterized protein LOC141913294 [Tubulanus polymorphus]|uniref:uncharacterized protein LOC141913294 n=1 Tax=Tubulanus polymorphus TaxID=672921 RepID=UPI003DA5A941